MLNNTRRLSPISEGDETEDNTTPPLPNPIEFGENNFVPFQGNTVGPGGLDSTQQAVATMFGPYDFISSSNPTVPFSSSDYDNDELQGLSTFVQPGNFSFGQGNIIYPLGFPGGITEEEHRKLIGGRMGKSKQKFKPQRTAAMGGLSSAQKRRRKEYITAFAGKETPDVPLNYIYLNEGVRLSPYGLNYQEALNLGLIDPTQGSNWGEFGGMNVPSVSPMYYVPTAQNFRSVLRNTISQQGQQYQNVPYTMFAGGRSMTVPAVPVNIETVVPNPPAGAIPLDGTSSFVPGFWSRTVSGIKNLGKKAAMSNYPAPVVGGRSQVPPPPGNNLRPSATPGVWKKFLTRAQSTWNSTAALSRAVGRGIATAANRGLTAIGRGGKRAGLAVYDIATGTAYPTFVTKADKALGNITQRTQNFFAGGRSAAVPAAQVIPNLKGEQYNPFGVRPFTAVAKQAALTAAPKAQKGAAAALSRRLSAERRARFAEMGTTFLPLTEEQQYDIYYQTCLKYLNYLDNFITNNLNMLSRAEINILDKLHTYLNNYLINAKIQFENVQINQALNTLDYIIQKFVIEMEYSNDFKSYVNDESFNEYEYRILLLDGYKKEFEKLRNRLVILIKIPENKNKEFQESILGEVLLLLNTIDYKIKFAQKILNENNLNIYTPDIVVVLDEAIKESNILRTNLLTDLRSIAGTAVPAPLTSGAKQNRNTRSYLGLQGISPNTQEILMKTRKGKSNRTAESEARYIKQQKGLSLLLNFYNNKIKPKDNEELSDLKDFVKKYIYDNTGFNALMNSGGGNRKQFFEKMKADTKFLNSLDELIGR